MSSETFLDFTNAWSVAHFGDCVERQSLFEIFSRVLTNLDSSITRQGFSRHLSTLEEAGLIKVEWDGKTKFHSLNKQPISAMLDGWINQYKE